LLLKATLSVTNKSNPPNHIFFIFFYFLFFFIFFYFFLFFSKNKNGHLYFENLRSLILHEIENLRKTYFSQYLESDSNAYMNF